MNGKLLLAAMAYYGLKPIPGKAADPTIAAWLAMCGLKPNDETSWCSAALNGWAAECGAERTYSPVARSWVTVGVTVEPENVIPGDVVVYWRGAPNSWKGHVGLVVRRAGTITWTLGGNQLGSVCVRPYSNNRVLSYRRLGPWKG